jgi:antitoxin (DNA-binding transcriptional repressor) of toxin-antitoxin stability system
MSSVSIEEAQARLPELIANLGEGESVIITRDRQPVAHLVPPPAQRPQPQFGSCRGKLTVISEDEEHLRDFADYMP